MCTAATYKTRDFYFGRNLDLEYSYTESVTITPRNFPFHFRCTGDMASHYAMIGIAFVESDYPLYYDAINEKGLCMAGLAFWHNAHYFPKTEGKDNVASFELIPWILGQCASVAEARPLLEKLNIADIAFTDELPPSALHWILSDKECSVVIESTESGLHIYEDPYGVLTNDPPFEYHCLNLANYLMLSCEPVENHFAPSIDIPCYSKGMGAVGLPGDLSSASRFVKAAFTRLHSVSGDSEAESVSQFFHILGSVAQQRGVVHLEGNKYEITNYSSCCNADKGIYYYITYENCRPTAVDMHRENLNGSELVSYSLRSGFDVYYEN